MKMELNFETFSSYITWTVSHPVPTLPFENDGEAAAVAV